MLQFWTEQCALLPAAEVQPEQQAEQRRLRSKLLRWAAKHPRHRDVVFLQDYMARVHDAAAASGWTDELWRLPLVQFSAIAENKNPAIILQRMPALRQELAAHGVRFSWGQCLILRLQGRDAAAKVAKLQLALESLPVSLDFLIVVRKAPTLMLVNSAEAELGRRVAAMQLLHPRLDIEKMLTSHPGPLTFTEEALAARWTSLQNFCELCDDDIMVLVQHQPTVFGINSGVIGWRVQQPEPEPEPEPMSLCAGC